MNSILSIFLALTMLVASIGLQGPVFFEAGINVDVDAFTEVMQATQGMAAQVPGASVMLPAAQPGEQNQEEALENTRKIVDILNAIKIRGVADEGAAELQFVAGEAPFLTAGVKAAESGTIVASSLLSPYTIVASPEALQKAAEQLRDSISGAQAQLQGNMDFQAVVAAAQKINQEQLTKDITEFTQKIQKGFKIGEPENGEFVVDDLQFTEKTAVDMTYEEIMELLLGSLKDLLNSESLKDLVKALAKDRDLTAEIDKSLENLKSLPEDQRPELAAVAYRDGTDDTYYTIDMAAKTGSGETAKTQKTHIGMGQAEGKGSLMAMDLDDQNTQAQVRAIGTLDGDAEMTANIVSKEQNAVIYATRDAKGNMDMTADIANQQTTAKIHTTETVKEDGQEYKMEVCMNGSEKPVITVTGTAGKGGEIVTAFEGDTLKPIDATVFEDAKASQTTMMSLTMMAGANALKAVVALSKNLPEETGTWLISMVQGLVKNTMQR